MKLGKWRTCSPQTLKEEECHIQQGRRYDDGFAAEKETGVEAGAARQGHHKRHDSEGFDPRLHGRDIDEALTVMVGLGRHERLRTYLPC